METWTTRELPVLRALVKKFDDVETNIVRIETLPAATGLDEIDVKRAVRSLTTADPPYAIGNGIDQLSYPIIITNVTERARRAVGQWPASQGFRGMQNRRMAMNFEGWGELSRAPRIIGARKAAQISG
jgi:hypothetical protein